MPFVVALSMSHCHSSTCVCFMSTELKLIVEYGSDFKERNIIKLIDNQIRHPRKSSRKHLRTKVAPDLHLITYIVKMGEIRGRKSK